MSGGVFACWPWTGALTRGGRRKVAYGHLRQAGGRAAGHWRAHRLALLIADPDYSGEVSLAALARKYAHLDAAHLCGNSLCCNPAHLEWQPHKENAQWRKTRRRS